MSATGDVFAAIDAGDRTRLEALLAEAPASATAHNAEGVSVLLYALYRGQRDLAAAIESANQPLDVFEASALGRPERVRELLAADRSLASAVSADGFTPLHLLAFFSGDPVLAALLLDSGADVDAVARNPTQVRPLHSAVAGRSDALARLLVERGASVNAAQRMGWTALHAAAQHGDVDLASFLLAHGADPQCISDDGKTAADLAQAGGHADLAAALRTSH